MPVPDKLIDKLKSQFPGLTYHISRVSSLANVANVRIAEHFSYKDSVIVSERVNNKTIWEYTEYVSNGTILRKWCNTLPEAITALVWGWENSTMFRDLPNLPYPLTVTPTVRGYWCRPICNIRYFGNELILNYTDDLYPIAIGAYVGKFPHALIDALEESVWGEFFEHSRRFYSTEYLLEKGII